VLRGVNVFPTQIEELLLRIPGLAPHFQLLLTSREHLDELTVRVEARAGLDAAGREAAARELATQVLSNVGVRVQVAVTDPDTIERSAGKMRRVIDERNR
jgi:phenylacetate-CoA ligase